MKSNTDINRRFFIKGTGVAALVGTATLTGCAEQTGSEPKQVTDEEITSYEKVNFDAGYNRVGTNSIKFDMIKMFNPDNQLDVGMGIADMDFRTLPQVTSALKKRLETENWGYELLCKYCCLEQKKV